MSLAEPSTSARRARLLARADALATRRNATLAAVLAAFVVLLLFAGLLRPEAWLLSGAYVLWMFPAKGLRGIWPYVALAVAPAVIWLAWDWIVTGKPLYSLTSTRATAGEFQRNRGAVAA